MRNEWLAYVREYLAAHGMDAVRPGQPFRARSSHTGRVMMWAERLLAQGGVENPEALRLAAAFHDVGYAFGREDHAAHSAQILRAYAREYGLDDALCGRACFLVSEHSNKERWLSDAAAPADLVCLMEADLLDEEGAMGLVLDCMTAANQPDAGYESAYAHMLRYEPKRLAKNPMVTPLARRFWEDKQRIIREFMNAFAFDLGIDHEA